MLLEIVVVVDVFVIFLRSSSFTVEYFLFFFYVDFDGDHDLLEGPGLGYVDWVYGPGLDDKYRLDDPGFRDPARRDNPGLSEDGLPCLSLGKASNSLNPIGCPGQW
jgi:hypothetical protein